VYNELRTAFQITIGDRMNLKGIIKFQLLI